MQFPRFSEVNLCGAGDSVAGPVMAEVQAALAEVSVSIALPHYKRCMWNNTVPTFPYWSEVRGYKIRAKVLVRYAASVVRPQQLQYLWEYGGAKGRSVCIYLIC